MIFPAREGNGLYSASNSVLPPYETVKCHLILIRKGIEHDRQAKRPSAVPPWMNSAGRFTQSNSRFPPSRPLCKVYASSSFVTEARDVIQEMKGLPSNPDRLSRPCHLSGHGSHPSIFFNCILQRPVSCRN